MALHLDFGRSSEEQALSWLQAHYSLTLLARNYRCKMGELDLIFEIAGELGGELIFVEVRGRAFGAMVGGVASIGPKKLQRIQNTIRYFLANYRGTAKTVRLDVMALDGDDWTHLKNVWS